MGASLFTQRKLSFMIHSKNQGFCQSERKRQSLGGTEQHAGDSPQQFENFR